MRIQQRRSIRSSPRHSPNKSPASTAAKANCKISSVNHNSDNEEVEEESLEISSEANISHDSYSFSYRELNLEIKRLNQQQNVDSVRSHRSNTKTPPINSQASSQGSVFNYIVLIIVIVAGVLAVIFWPFNSKMVGGKIECSQFKELTKEFTHQDELLWKSLKVGIENVLNKIPTQPSVFLLAYNDPKTSKTLMNKILNVTANCMRSRDPIQLEGGTFATEVMVEDYGEVIKAYKTRLENEGILYVSDINRTPAKVAQVFHAICDTKTPLVEKSVIFFTMYVEQYDRNMPPEKIHAVVEQQLENSWNDITYDSLHALIGRVTDQVFLLHSENDV